MGNVVLDGVSYQYAYKGSDLISIMKHLSVGNPYDAMVHVEQHCIKNVEDNEQNAPLRARLALVILQELSVMTTRVAEAKNSVVPSPVPAGAKQAR